MRNNVVKTPHEGIPMFKIIRKNDGLYLSFKRHGTSEHEDIRVDIVLEMIYSYMRAA